MTKSPSKLVVSFGGGVNSSALLLGYEQRKITPDLILFADTGNEFESTYEHVTEMSRWCEESFGITITIVHRSYARHKTLEDECHNLETLPSKAFGFSGCSVKWKRQPMDRFVRHWDPAKEAWAAGLQVTRSIGIDAGESHRGKIPDCSKFHYVFPLIEWDWDREKCIEVLKNAGLTPPRKSACWFCPASRKAEVIALSVEHPDLFARAVEMERIALEAGKLKVVKGLGRHWSWKELVASDKKQLFPEATASHCIECHDGTTE